MTLEDFNAIACDFLVEAGSAMRAVHDGIVRFT